MARHKMLALILLSIFISAQAYGQEAGKRPVNSISGKVAGIDIESGVITLKIEDVLIPFNIMPESALYMSTHLISIVEISANDPVTIEYVNASGKNEVVSLTDTKSEK